VIVIDASALAKYVLYEEGWEQVSRLVKSMKPIASVDHVLKEVGNAIWKHCCVRRIIDEAKAMSLYEKLLKLVETGVIVLESETDYLLEVMRIALEYKITLYDALYIAQALKKGALLTSDKKQAEIASRYGVRVYLVE
jgi:predicted nucleic acid-binding protein